VSLPPAFEALRAVDLSEIRGEAAWSAHNALLEPWLIHADQEIRRQALERLTMGILAAEEGSVVVARNEGVTVSHDPPARLQRLLAVVEAAHAAHPDMIPAFLGELRHKHDAPFVAGLLTWLRGLAESPPDGVDPGMIEGTMLLLQRFDEDDPADVSRLVGLLDHASEYVRACAAKQLANVDGAAMDAAALFALIREKELVRPGIAGAFWSDWQFSAEHAPVEPLSWMLDIVENRAGPEPEHMPFNGIDFYLHEIADRSPETVLRLLACGRGDIAIETATEMRGVVEDMRPVLLRLADDHDPGIAHRARMHLAMYYRVLHPAAEAAGLIRHWPDWALEADTFSFHHDNGKKLWFVVLYPRSSGGVFSDAGAWALIDRLLPPDQRGPLVHHDFDYPKDGPARAYRLGDQLMHRYALSEVTLTGDVTSQAWTRLDVMGWKLGPGWAPFGTV
jgi:hypothetical protein